MTSRLETAPETGKANDSLSLYPEIPYSTQSIDDSDKEAVLAVLNSPRLAQGPLVPRFEEALARFTGSRHVIAVSSGTAALHLACLALGMDRESRGYVPPVTFAATANAVRYAGAEVAFTDSDARHGRMTAHSLAVALEEQPPSDAAVSVALPVSLNGSAAGLDRIAAVGHQAGLRVIEDAAHSLGARYRDETGTFHASASCAHSDCAILSFHPVKAICTGEGGAVTSNDDALADRVRLLRSHGISRAPTLADDGIPYPGWYYEQHELGFNYRMNELQAALGLSQLHRLGGFLAQRRALARRYQDCLSASPFSSCLALLPWDPESAFHLYPVRFRDCALRDSAHAFLKERGIHTQVHYIPVYRHPYYRNRYGSLTREGAEAYFSGCLSLPLYPDLTKAAQDRVLENLEAFCRKV